MAGQPSDEAFNALSGDSQILQGRQDRQCGCGPCGELECQLATGDVAQRVGENRHEDDRDRDRVKQPDDRTGNGEDLVQTGGCDDEGNDRESGEPRLVADLGYQAREELRGRDEQADCGRHAGCDDDEAEGDLTEGAERQIRSLGQELGAVVEGVRPGHLQADQAQAEVDEREEAAGDCRGDGGALDGLRADSAAGACEGGDDDDSEGEAAEGVHCEVAGQDACGERV